MQKKLGISMRGGAWNTCSYIGVLKALGEEKIEVSMIICSSGGSITGSLYAAGLPFDEIKRAYRDYTPRKYIGIDSLKELSVASDDKTIEYGRTFIGDTRIEETRIKLWLQATNVGEGKPEFLKEGDLATAIVASGALPMIFHPIKFNGKEYIDGDITSGFGAGAMRAEGVEVVLGLSCDHPFKPGEDHDSIHARVLEPLRMSMHVIRSQDLELHPVDLHISGLGVPNSPIFDYEHIDKNVEDGYRRAKEIMPQLKALLEAPAPTKSLWRRILGVLKAVGE